MHGIILQFCEQGVLSLFKKLENKNLCSCGNVLVFFAQISRLCDYKTINAINQLLFGDCVFPDALKISKAIPLYKRDRLNVGNHRQTSLISSFLKNFVCETAI